MQYCLPFWSRKQWDEERDNTSGKASFWRTKSCYIAQASLGPMISCLGSYAMRTQKCSTMPSPHATVIRTIFRWMILIALVTFPLVSWRKTILSWINSSIQAHVLLQMPASCPETLCVLVRWVRYLPSSDQPAAHGFCISHTPGSKPAFELLGGYGQVPEVISAH